MSDHAHNHTNGDDFVIGFSLGPFGRMVRLLAALYFLLFFCSSSTDEQYRAAGRHVAL